MELLTAAKQGSLGVVRALVSHPSCDLLARDEEGNTALHIAASRGHHDVVLELASRYTAPSGEVYAGVNNKGQTPLHLACSNGWIKCVDHLINKLHFDFNIKDVSGNTPLKSASKAKHNDIILLLLQKYEICIGIKEESNLKTENCSITGGSSCLLVAAKQGSLGVVRALVSHPSCDLLARDEEGNTALHIAASRGHHDVVLELASRYTAPSGEAYDGVNNEGQTPLHLACYKGWIKCVDPLAIKFPKEMYVKDNNGNTPIMAASLAGHKTLVSLLKERYKVAIDSKEGELLNHKEDKHKPKLSDQTEASSCLLAAAKQGSLGVVRALVSHPSCDLLARDEEGNTALHIAASRGHHDVVLELASRYTAPSGEVYAGVNNKGQTPLHLACRNGWIKCVDHLINKLHFDFNLKEVNGNTPLKSASIAGHNDIILLLLQKCKVCIGNETKEESNRNPENISITGSSLCLLAAAKQGSLGVVRALVSHPSCDLLARDEEGNTALHIAASRGHHDVVLELASRYTAPSGEIYAGVNNEGQTPLHLACRNGWVDCTQTVATMFPEDLNVKNEYDNLPIHDAALFGHGNVVDCLCEEFGCDVDSLGRLNRTCLFLACSGGHMKLAHSLLVKYGCRRDALDDMGGLATTCAAYYGYTHLLEMLIDEFNFSPNAVRLTDGDNLFHQACAGKHYVTANILINKYNLDPLSKDIHGYSALHYLCRSNDHALENVGNFHTPADVEITTFVDHLISLKCDPMDRDNEGGNALHFAAFSGQTEVIIQLVRKYKCLVEYRDNYGNTPLHYAAGRGHVHVVEALLSDLAADVEARNKQNGTALHIAVM